VILAVRAPERRDTPAFGCFNWRVRFLSSAQNPEIKATARLKDRRDREREGRYLIEGSRELDRAFNAGVRIERVYVSEEHLRPNADDALAAMSEAGIEIVAVSAHAFEKLSMRENPDGVIAVAPIVPRALPDLPADALVLVLVGLEKPGNLGALLRTADGVGVHAVIVAGRGVDLHSPNVIRASQGSVFTLPVVHMNDEDALTTLRQHAFRLVACTPEGAVTYWSTDLRGRVALLLGTEHEGLPPAWRALAHDRVSIPMRGTADSLNVATAGALVLYEALRQRERH